MMRIEDTYGDEINIEITPTAVSIEVIDPDGKRVKRFVNRDEAVEICEAIINAAKQTD